jgi:hypothetical protein
MQLKKNPKIQFKLRKLVLPRKIIELVSDFFLKKIMLYLKVSSLKLFES